MELTHILGLGQIQILNMRKQCKILLKLLRGRNLEEDQVVLGGASTGVCVCVWVLTNSPRWTGHPGHSSWFGLGPGDVHHQQGAAGVRPRRGDLG